MFLSIMVADKGFGIAEITQRLCTRNKWLEGKNRLGEMAGNSLRGQSKSAENPGAETVSNDARRGLRIEK